MSFLMGKPAVSQVPQQLNSIQVDRSRYGDPVPLLYGTDRLPALLGWYGGFNATAQTQSSAGKGGGSKNITGYNYTASCVMLLCEGFSSGVSIGQVWKDKAITTLTAEGLVPFSGTPGQAVWSYLTTNFASQAINYNLTAYIAGQNINLGSSAALANYNYEVHGILAQAGISITLTSGLAVGATSATLTGPSTGLVANGLWDITFSDFETRSVTVTGSALTWDAAFPLTLAVTSAAIIGGFDADPSAIWLDFCQDTNHGANFFLTDPGIQGANSYQTYCKANSMQLSVLEDTQRPASSALKDILEITNSDCFMSANVLKIVPYCDAVVSGNGVTFTPNLTPLFSFTDDDYLPASQGASSSSQSDDPVQCIRKPLTQTFNCVRVEYADRADNYNIHIAEWKDPLDIKVNGLRVMQTKTFHQIKNFSLAHHVATLIGQRQLYVRRTFIFSVRADLYTLLEPMDPIALTDTMIVGGLETRLGLVNQLCRVTRITDDENDVFTIMCEELLVGTSSAPRYNLTSAQGFFANYAALPPSIATPVVFLAPAALVGANGGFELWCAIGAGAGGSYGGCNVYGSLDDLTWSFLGTVEGQARLGTVTTAHAISASTSGAADTFFLTMNAATDAAGYQLDSASAADFAANRSLIWVDGEVVSFQTVTLLSTALYSVTVKRGLFGTTAAAHAVGANWCRLDPAIFTFAIDPGMVGQTIHLKGYSFNLFGQQTQTIATDFATVINTPPGQFIGSQLTLVSTNVMVNGNNVSKTGGAASTWDSQVFSGQSYVNGAFVSFQPQNNTDTFVIGLNSDPATDANYTSIDYGLECSGTAGGTGLNVVNNGTAVFSGLAYAAGDILSVSYDGAFIRYLQNNVVFFQQPAPPNLQLFLDSSFFNSGAIATNLQFGPYGTATPTLWVPRGAVVAGHETVSKTSGTSAWEDAYSTNGYATAHIMVTAGQSTGNTAIAINTAAPATPAQVAAFNLSYAMVLDNTGNVDIWEAGSLVVSNVTTYTVSDQLSIVYTGTSIIYKYNDATLRTVTVTTGQNMYGEVLLFDNNTSLNNVEFGPGAVVPVINTPKLAGNAATSINTSFTAGPVTVNNFAGGSNGPTPASSLSAGPFPFATTVVITVNAAYSYTVATAEVPITLNAGISTVSASLTNIGDLTITVADNIAGRVYQGNLSQERTFSLAANTTTTYFWNALTINGLPQTGNFKVAAILMKAEIVKK